MNVSTRTTTDPTGLVAGPRDLLPRGATMGVDWQWKRRESLPNQKERDASRHETALSPPAPEVAEQQKGSVLPYASVEGTSGPLQGVMSVSVGWDRC